MKKAFKVTGIIIAIIIILIALACLAVNLVLTPSNVKKTLASQVKKQTGRELSIEKLSWSFFPTLSVNVGNINLSNMKGFGDLPFLTLDSASIGVKVLPLLNKQIKTSNISINGLTLNLVENKQGQTNWDFSKVKKQITKTEKSAAAKQTPQSQKNQASTKAKPAAQLYFDIPKVSAKNINIHFYNEKNSQRINLDNISLEAGNITNDKAFPFSTSINISHNKPLMKMSTKLAGNLTLSPNSQFYKLSNGSLDANLTNKSGTKRLRISKINTEVRIQNDKIQIQPISAMLYGGKLTGMTIINLLQKVPAYAFSGNLNGVAAQALLTDLMQVKKFSGTGSVKARISTRGEDGSALTKNLNGAGNFAFKNGAFHGMDLAFIIRGALSLLSGKIKPVANQHLTKFGHLTGTFNIRNGNVSNTINMTTPVMKVSCRGNANLVTERLNYNCKATLEKGSLQNLISLTSAIPFTISGSFKKVSVTPNVQGLIGETIKQQLGGQIQKTIGNLPGIKNIKLPKLFD